MPERYKEIGVSWHLKGNGGINSSIEDMYKWYIALKKGKIISKASRQKLFEPYIVSSIEYNKSYAYGWGISQSERKTKIASHSGANPAFYSDIFMFVGEDIFIIYCTNQRSNQIEYFGWEFQKLIFDPTAELKELKRDMYKVVFDFIMENNPEKIDEILPLIEKEFGSKLTESNILNRIGFLAIGSSYTHWAIPLLELNVILFPGDGNLWDSLGEAYASANQKEDAIKSFEKALELKPKDECNWCENSNSKLETLLND